MCTNLIILFLSCLYLIRRGYHIAFALYRVLGTFKLRSLESGVKLDFVKFKIGEWVIDGKWLALMSKEYSILVNFVHTNMII